MLPSSTHKPYSYVARPQPVLGMTGRIALALGFLLLCAVKAFGGDVAVGTAMRQARVKDISSIEGIRDNQLVGYGIVVGLNGTGG